MPGEAGEAARGGVMSSQFAVLGAGAWGTAVAMILAQNPQHRVSLWSARPENAAWHSRRENVRLLPGVMIPQSILLTTDIGQAVENVDLLVAAIPTVHLRSTLARIAPAILRGKPLLSLVQGLEY